MAINRLAAAALRLLSYPNIDVKKNYRLDRAAKRLLHPSMKFLWQAWDHTVTRDGYPIPVRLFIPDELRSQDIFLFFHGGGWVSGDIDSYTQTCGTLAKMTGRRVLSVDYRLAPEHRFPVGLEDCYAVARTLFAVCAEENSPLQACPQDIILIGDSAGGNLAAAVSLMAADRGEFMPRRQILLYPAVQSDFGPQSPFPSVRENGRSYLLTAANIADYLALYMRSEADRQNPYFSPLLAPDLHGQPKTLLITAEYDPLRDEGSAYAERLKQDDVPIVYYQAPDALHGFFSLPPVFDAVRDAYRVLNAFLDGDEDILRDISDIKENTQTDEASQK
ncbi:MAG: alpha/beta hydrolase [Clostridia bacterium]|nr:alpha/beta hydrolase [Clostridia bacterium]